MSYLIDTHILLWWLSDDKKLKSKIRRIIATEAVWVSSAVIWEMVIKSELGKLTIPDNIEETINAEHFNILDIKLPHIMELKNLEKIHSNPFDRIQIAQAKFENLTLITKDKNIMSYNYLNIMAA